MKNELIAIFSATCIMAAMVRPESIWFVMATFFAITITDAILTKYERR